MFEANAKLSIGILKSTGLELRCWLYFPRNKLLIFFLSTLLLSNKESHSMSTISNLEPMELTKTVLLSCKVILMTLQLTYKSEWWSQVLRATASVQQSASAFVWKCCYNLVIAVKTFQYQWYWIQLYVVILNSVVIIMTAYFYSNFALAW